jgi:hypothetical protein
VLPFGVVLSSLHDGSSATFGGRAHQDLTGGMSHHDYIPKAQYRGEFSSMGHRLNSLNGLGVAGEQGTSFGKRTDFRDVHRVSRDNKEGPGPGWYTTPKTDFDFKDKGGFSSSDNRPCNRPADFDAGVIGKGVNVPVAYNDKSAFGEQPHAKALAANNSNPSFTFGERVTFGAHVTYKNVRLPKPTSIDSGKIQKAARRNEGASETHQLRRTAAFFNEPLPVGELTSPSPKK